MKKFESWTDGIAAYKGFDQDLKCRGFQFEIGKTYKHKGEVSVCNSCFHACENPLEVFEHYPPTSRFAIVKCAGEISKGINDKKNRLRGIDSRSRNPASGIDFRCGGMA